MLAPFNAVMRLLALCFAEMTLACSLQAEAHRAQTLADKAAALPPESASGAADTVAVLIRLPNGQRLTRRWAPPHALRKRPTAACSCAPYVRRTKFAVLTPSLDGVANRCTCHYSMTSRIDPLQVPEDRQTADSVRLRRHKRARRGMAPQQLPACHQQTAQGAGMANPVTSPAVPPFASACKCSCRCDGDPSPASACDALVPVCRSTRRLQARHWQMQA